jgi:Fur family ferric uptake transcriptional regulator
MHCVKTSAAKVIHHDNHVHFICDDCGTAYCLENISIPEVKLPAGFKQVQTDVLVSGVCDKCS